MPTEKAQVRREKRLKAGKKKIPVTPNHLVAHLDGANAFVSVKMQLFCFPYPAASIQADATTGKIY